MEEQKVIRGSASAGQGKPPGAKSSVFDNGAVAKPARQVVDLDPEQVLIHSGVPLPGAVPGRQSPWPTVYAKMKAGDMVRLSQRQAVSFMSWGKKHEAKLAKRTFGGDSAGVWRLA